MTEEAGSDDVFERIENGQDGDNLEEAEMGDDGSRGNRVDDPVSFFYFKKVAGLILLYYASLHSFKGASLQISDLIQMIKTGQRS